MRKTEIESPPNSSPPVFVGGPFHHAVSDSGIFDPLVGALIVKITTSLEKAGFTILSSHLTEEFGQILNSTAEEIARRDFEWMQNCSAYVCLLPNHEDGKSYRSDGCCIELGWASALKKPTILVRDMNTSFTDLIVGLGALGSVEHLSMKEVANDPNLLIEALHLLLGGSMERSAV
jgi:hypothetical protein